MQLSISEILPTLPKDQLNKVARFLEARGTMFFLPPPLNPKLDRPAFHTKLLPELS